MNVTYTFPWPPSVNHYWISMVTGKRVRVIVGKKGVYFRTEVGYVVGECTPTSDRLEVHIDAYPPDNRKRDLDNMMKATLDAMEHAGVYENDAQIDMLSIHRKSVTPGGKLVVTIRSI